MKRTLFALVAALSVSQLPAVVEGGDGSEITFHDGRVFDRRAVVETIDGVVTFSRVSEEVSLGPLPECLTIAPEGLQYFPAARGEGDLVEILLPSFEGGNRAQFSTAPFQRLPDRVSFRVDLRGIWNGPHEGVSVSGRYSPDETLWSDWTALPRTESSESRMQFYDVYEIPADLLRRAEATGLDPIGWFQVRLTWEESCTGMEIEQIDQQTRWAVSGLHQ